MFKRKAPAFTLVAALLLSNSVVLTNEAAASSHKAKQMVTASKLDELSIKDLNDRAKATFKHVKEVLPDLKKYEIDSITIDQFQTNSGPIERLELILSGTPEGTSPNFGVVQLNANTGELLSVDLQNGLLSSKEVLGEKEAIKKGIEHLKHLFGEKADSYKFSEISYSTFQNNKTQLLVIYTSPDHSVYVTMDSIGELKAARKDIYPQDKEEAED